MTTEYADLLIRAGAIHTQVPGQDPQREVLGQVVTGQDGVPEQRGDAEDEGRQRDEEDDGDDVGRPAPGGPGAEGLDGPRDRCC